MQFKYGTCNLTGTSGELGSYYGVVNLKDIPDNCVAIIPIGATYANSQGYPAIMSPRDWEKTTLKTTSWSIVASKAGTYGYAFACLIG